VNRIPSLVAVFAAVAMSGLAHAQTLLFERLGPSANANFGDAVANVGDVDGDGAEDWAAGAPGANSVTVFSGRTMQVLHTWTGASRFGTSIAAAGDLDGDGFGDVIVGAPNGVGSAHVFSGASGATLLNLTGSSDGFGQAVAGGGKIDGDSVPDLLVGAPYSDLGATWSGAVHVFSGSNGSVIRTHVGSSFYRKLGTAVSMRGDTNGDGREEYLLAGTGYCSFGDSEVSGVDGATGTVQWSDVMWSVNQYGCAVTVLNDVTGDGIREVVGGAMNDGGIGCAGNGQGRIRVLNGATGALLFQKIDTGGYYAGLGWSLTALGDLNGNGSVDFAAGRPGTEGCGGASAQSIRIYDGLTGVQLLTLSPPAGSQAFGESLAFCDANGDGLRDLIVGAPCSSAPAAYAGKVYVYTIVRVPTVYCESEVNSLGCTPQMAGAGVPSATSASPFQVQASSVLNQKTGLLFYGFKPRQTPFQGGAMCIVSPTVRTPLQTSGGNALPANDCSGAFSLDFNARIQSGVDPMLVAGEEVFAQYWSRDPGDASTTNLTNALAWFINP
jgi:hypothetical protein